MIKKQSQKINLIITAGGLSQRFGVENKLFAPLNSSCVLVEALKPFLKYKQITRIIVAIEPSFSDEFLNRLSVEHLDEDSRIILTVGGATRTQTVKRALFSLDEDCQLVLIHDGARPFVSTGTIDAVIAGAKECGAALPVLALIDSLVSIYDGVLPVNREHFGRVQTPVCATKQRIVDAYSACDKDYFDDIAVIQTYCKGDVKIVEGDSDNIKITVKEDLKTPLTGCGYDIHRIEKCEENGGVTLNGSFIACPFKAVAHSDGDVPVHAIMDALLSAVGEKDIGHLFPVDDTKYDNADSMTLLQEVVKIVHSKGYKLVNAAVCIIAEKPFIAPHIDQMRNNLSKTLMIPAANVGITATSNEQVGEIGSGNAIAAYATVLVI